MGEDEAQRTVFEETVKREGCSNGALSIETTRTQSVRTNETKTEG